MLLILVAVLSSGVHSLPESFQDKFLNKLQDSIKIHVEATMNLKDGVICENANDINEIRAHFPIDPTLSTIYSFKECTFIFEKEPMSIIVRYKKVTESAGEVVVSFRNKSQELAHSFEFTMKHNVHSVKKTNDDKGSEAETEAEIANIINEVQRHLKNVIDTITLVSAKEINNRMIEIVSGPDGLVTNPAIGQKCFKSDQYCFTKTQLKVGDGSAPGINLEIVTTKPNSKTGLAAVSLKLGSRQFSLKVPASQSLDKWKEISGSIKITLDNWITENSKNEIVDFKTAIKILLESTTKSCYQHNQNDKSVENEELNSFVLDLNLDATKSGCNIDKEGLIKRADNIKILLLTYEYGYFNYAQLFLDSPMQSSEFIIELNLATFSANLGTQIQEFFKDNTLTLSKNAEIKEITIEAIEKKMKDYISDVRCQPKNEAQKDEYYCKKGKSPQIIAKIYEIKNPDHVFRIKFVYPKKSSSLGESPRIQTNQLVFQKYNSYDQLRNLEEPLKVISGTLLAIL